MADIAKTVGELNYRGRSRDHSREPSEETKAGQMFRLTKSVGSTSWSLHRT